MRLVTFSYDNERRLGGRRIDGGRETIVDLQAADSRIPADMLSFLAAGEPARELAAAVLAAPPPTAVHDAAAVRLEAPVPRPGKIICIGLNYRDHAEESKMALPEYPTVFSKYSNAVIGPGAPIVIPAVTDQVDYEAELGVVIGRRAKSVAEREALEYVGGYLPFNDVSARDYQMRTSQWTVGKTFDTFAPMGPALVTADELGDPHNLAIRLRIGDELLQDSNTRHLIFTVDKIVAYLSSVMTLDPGDVIATGTPAGVGMARTPQRFLRPGDVVEVEIEGVGTLQNPVVAAS